MSEGKLLQFTACFSPKWLLTRNVRNARVNLETAGKKLAGCTVPQMIPKLDLKWSRTATVIPSNSNTFSDWRRTCHVSLVKFHDALRQQQLELSTRMWSGRALLKLRQICFASCVKQIIFYAVMAAKRFQTRTEEEIEQLLHDKSSKSTNKATDNAVPAGSFAVRDHLRSNLRSISGLGIICGRGSFAALYTDGFLSRPRNILLAGLRSLALLKTDTIDL